MALSDAISILVSVAAPKVEIIAVAALRIQAGPGQAKLPEVIARREARDGQGQEGAS